MTRFAFAGSGGGLADRGEVLRASNSALDAARKAEPRPSPDS